MHMYTCNHGESEIRSFTYFKFFYTLKFERVYGSYTCQIFWNFHSKRVITSFEMKTSIFLPCPLIVFGSLVPLTPVIDPSSVKNSAERERGERARGERERCNTSPKLCTRDRLILRLCYRYARVNGKSDGRLWLPEVPFHCLTRSQSPSTR